MKVRAEKNAQALKNGDGSYTVRVFSSFDKSTDVLFPMDSENEQLALEYANFKNAQAESGPLSPATQAVVADLKASEDPQDLHERLMGAAQLVEDPEETAAWRERNGL